MDGSDSPPKKLDKGKRPIYPGDEGDDFADFPMLSSSASPVSSSSSSLKDSPADKPVLSLKAIAEKFTNAAKSMARTRIPKAGSSRSTARSSTLATDQSTSTATSRSVSELMAAFPASPSDGNGQASSAGSGSISEAPTETRLFTESEPEDFKPPTPWEIDYDDIGSRKPRRRTI